MLENSFLARDVDLGELAGWYIPYRANSRADWLRFFACVQGVCEAVTFSVF